VLIGWRDMMEFRILGPLEAHADGHRIDLGPYKQRALLALLLMHVDRVVPTDRILDELWGDDAAGKEKALWVHISRLRSALEPHRSDRGESTVLMTRDHGYLIRVDPASVDARRFESALDEARATLSHDPDAAAEILREALTLWRGGALQDFAYDDFAGAEIARLEDLRLQALETRIEADLQRGLSGELVGELEELVQREPLRERPLVQLMHALYRAGRHAEALRAFQRFRRKVGDELGIEPSPELCRLEEQILVHDTRLIPASLARATVQTRSIVNPFKGLQTFREADAEDFFGRDRLVAEVIGRINGGTNLVALVGPSGSGKSSVVRAGVVPALRKGTSPGSDTWLLASMVPGAHPFAELEAALLRSTIDAPQTMAPQLEDATLGLLRAVLRVLPDDTSRLVLVIDQFEELFTLVEDETERRRFLANLVAALDDPHRRVVLILTLRADSYHRPLGYAEFAARLASNVVNVLPLASDELESAAQGPAARAGVSLEPALLAELLADVIGEPGALPIFQYALTELFDRRDGDVLTASAYRAMGGVRGALSRRADDLYHRLTLDEQEAARQLLLRLVTITENDDWGRRRVPASEIVALNVDVVTMESVIDQLGQQRFLAFDRDHSSAAPTVEVAHEALLWEWDRLRGWIEDGRQDVKRRAALDAAVAEWSHAGRDADYLLAGNRLAEYERWRTSTSMRLTATEQEYLDVSLTRRDQDNVTERARTAREEQLGRRARHRWWALVAGAAALAVVATVVYLSRPDTPSSVALLYGGRGDDIGKLVGSGLDRAVEDFSVSAKEITPPLTDLDDTLGRLTGTDLVIARQEVAGISTAPIAARHPNLKWGYVDIVVPGAPSVVFAEQQGAFLVGAAAALTSQTGTIGFVGGFQFIALERTRAGSEAGARAANPSIKILANYVDVSPTAFARADLASASAADMYERGADVVLHVAGDAGYGVFRAAHAESDALGRHVWAIGMDSDQILEAKPPEQAYVLTSMIKKFDVAVYELIHMLVDGDLRPGARILGLADEAVGYSTTGGHLSPDTVAALERYRQEIVAGSLVVPSAPTGALEPPLGSTVATTLAIRFDGSRCSYDGPTQLGQEIVRVEFDNNSDVDGWVDVTLRGEFSVQVPAAAGTSNAGYAGFKVADNYTFTCHSGSATTVAGPTIHARAG
jgi:basic membrane lipoprotein Med (substrate-binding protein (PBP1-ABC) superfamily)/DNA-binding SARP family transcriptional activator